MKLQKRFRAQTWAISIATAILTPLLSGLAAWIVMVYQESIEHSFASRQKSEERQQKLIDEKARLTGEAARLLGQMLGMRRQLALDAWRIECILIITVPADTKVGTTSKGDLDQAENVEREDSIRLFSTTAELESVFKISSIHFGSRTQDAIRRLRLIAPPLDYALNAQASVSEASSLFTTKIKAEEEYANSVYEVLDTMASEVAGELTSK